MMHYVGCSGENPSSTVTSQQQTPGSSTLSEIGCEVACSLTRSDLWGSADSNVHTVRDKGPFMTITYDREPKHIWNPNTESTSYFADCPKDVLHILFNS